MINLRNGLSVSILIILITSGCATSLNNAIQKGDFQAVKSIIQRDSSKIDEINDEGGTPLHTAISMGDLEIIKYLVSNGADIQSRNTAGDTPLHYAVFLSMSSPDVSLETVKYLVSHGADVNAQENYFKRTPLHQAALLSYRGIINCLIEQGASVHVKDAYGSTPLHEAVTTGKIEIVKLLVIKGSDVNAKNLTNWTPLHKAVWSGDLEIVKYLVSNGSDINVATQYGITPLHLATGRKKIQIVKYLISRGADITAKDKKGETALNLAQNRGYTEIRDYLISKSKTSDNKYLTKKPKEKIEDRPNLKKQTKPETFQKEISPIPLNIDFGHYYALVIGNNNYQYLTKLRTAESDAKEIAALLKNYYGFRVDLLTDATRSDILLALGKLRKKLTKRDNLLIYYAGHGWMDEEEDEGYWLPIDATEQNIINWVSNSSITNSLRAIQAKHILVVADSCYSGKLSRGIHAIKRTPGYLSRISKKKARSVLSSGGLEPVADTGYKGNHSVFASALIDALEENTGVIDGTELFSKIRRPVMLNSDQTPEYSDIRKAGHDGGDFLFVRIR